MKRRDFLTAASAAVLSASCATMQNRQAGRKPNIVYVFSDEHRWQSMSFTEMPALHTPTMARMAREGANFTHCISNYPVCSPYRAMAMTGEWPYQTGMTDNNLELSPHRITVGKLFQHAGYRTGYIGKWHLGSATDARPYGFDTSLIWTRMGNHQEGAVFHPVDGEPQKTTGYNATLMTNQALQFLQECRDEPFFLMLSLHPPHATFTDAPDAKKALYSEASLPYRPNVPEETANDGSGEERIWDRNSWPHYQGYHAHISAVDDEFMRILDALDRLGIADDTYVIYTSDHGTMMGSHGLGSKRQPYEESIRIPFLVTGPDVAAREHNELIGAIDMVPTLCGLAGIHVPESCAGHDFSGTIRGGGGPDPESQFIMHIAKDNASGAQNHPGPIFRGVRTARYTYAVGPDGVWGLYDNETDPYQMHNLKDSVEHDAVRRELHALTRDWLARADDPFPLPEV